ncbi:MAG: hypothetical protein CMB56_004770 [Methanobacteriota archaeon]|mgnify:CR=1 FL=1|nr:MAG: hypothetical protein CMB56_004770 [Euryarchaeota archaeon]
MDNNKRQMKSKKNKTFFREAKARAEERFSQNKRPMAFPEGEWNPKTIEISWKVKPVPKNVEIKVGNYVVRKGEFGWLEDERMDEIAKFIDNLDITLDQALSLRSAILQEKSVYSFHHLQRNVGKLRKLYDDGQSILELSKRFDYPPMNIFRGILKSRGWSKIKIKEALKSPEKKLNQRDQREFIKAEGADRVSNVNQSENAKRADLFEEILCEHFESKGVRIRRQSEMVTEQSVEHGRPIRTPDLLLLDNVIVNGQPIAWVDAKHFYGADISFQRKKTIKQMNRYIEEWGQGAIVFRHGYSANLKIPGAILLDSSQLDLEKLSQI